MLTFDLKSVFYYSESATIKYGIAIQSSQTERLSDVHLNISRYSVNQLIVWESADDTSVVVNQLTVNMAMADIPTYRDCLPPNVKARYDEIIRMINNIDPYSIDKDDFSSDVKQFACVTNFDIINYLVFTTSAYTKDQVKAYKSLEAYNHFINGWVHDVKVKVFQTSDVCLHVSKVSSLLFVYLQYDVCVFFYLVVFTYYLLTSTSTTVYSRKRIPRQTDYLIYCPPVF